MKIYDKHLLNDAIRRKNVRREIEILYVLNDPRIIKLNHVIDTSQTVFYYNIYI